MRTYLVTGGAGFIGSAFVYHLLGRDGAAVVNLDLLSYAGSLHNLDGIADHPRHTFVRGDIRSRDTVCALLREYPIDVVVNFAAESHVDRSILDPPLFADTNILGTVNLLDCVRRAWRTGKDQYRSGCRFVQVSTDEVYGSLGSDGLFTEQTPLNPHNPYAASKASADLMVGAYADTYRLPVQIARCSNNYGPRQHPEKFIPTVLRRALAHEPVPLYGDGMQVRDWLHVDDCCTALALIAERGEPGRIYNIGARGERTNLELAGTLLAVLRRQTGDRRISGELLSHVADRRAHDRRYGIDAGRIRRELGWRPLVPFDQGIEATVAWYLEHRDRAS